MLPNIYKKEGSNMPPKAKYTREEIVNIALDLVAAHGTSALNARSLGAALGTSTRPVFTAFKSMGELLEEVRTAAMERFNEYVNTNVIQPPFKNVGMKMVRFAAEQPKLFQLLYMSENENTRGFDGVFDELGENSGKCIEYIMRDYVMNHEDAMKLFRSVWLYTFGIGVMIASKVCQFDENEVSDMLSNQFLAVIRFIKSGSPANPMIGNPD